MSTLPGGPADKAGLIHEALWGVYAMLKVLCGEADSICIEEPGVDGAEFHRHGPIRPSPAGQPGETPIRKWRH